MSSQQFFIEAVLGSSFGISAFVCSIHTDICVDLFAESNGAPATVAVAKLCDDGVTDRSAIRRTLYVHALPSTSTADLIVIRSVKAHEDFPSPLYLIPSKLARKVKSS